LEACPYVQLVGLSPRGAKEGSRVTQHFVADQCVAPNKTPSRCGHEIRCSNAPSRVQHLSLHEAMDVSLADQSVQPVTSSSQYQRGSLGSATPRRQALRALSIVRGTRSEES